MIERYGKGGKAGEQIEEFLVYGFWFLVEKIKIQAVWREG
jgi:hypothetical protein